MIRIESKLEKEITDYCYLNGIKDVKKFVNKLLLKAFTIEKYGDSPFQKNVEVNTDKVQYENERHKIEEKVIETIIVPTLSSNKEENVKNKKITKIIKK